MAWHKNTDPINKTEVNHIRIDLNDNRPENVEWCTPKENNVHSEVMRRDNKRCTVRAVRGYEEHAFFSAYEAAEWFKTTPTVVWNSIKSDIDLNGWIVSHIPWDSAVLVSLRKQRGMLPGYGGSSASTPVYMLDTDNGDVTHFESLREAALSFGVTATHIWRAIDRSIDGPVKLFRKRYMFQYVGLDFPTYTPEELAEARFRGPKEVICRKFPVTEGNIDQWFIYPTAKEFYTENNLSRKAVTTALAADVIKNVDGWVFLYLSKENTERLMEHTGCPEP